MPRTSPRRVDAGLAGALVVAVLAASASSAPSRAASAPPLAHALVADAQAPLRTRRLQQVPISFRGGPVTTSTGEVVDVRVSDTLPVETATPEGWAEFLAGLTHGPELGRLTAYVVTFAEVQQICGSRAAGCYGANQIVVPGETSSELTPQAIVRHEYGHHVGYHRNNSPWLAVDWGPKRWASVADVCARVARGEAHPGDQGANYPRNPGEVWAETYRLMDERKAGITTATWPIVSPGFFPNDAALRAAEQDVVQPWTAPRTTTVSRMFGKATPKVWWIPVAASLDGDLRISATVPNNGNPDVALVASNRQTVIRRAQWVGQRVKRMSGSICGQRSLFVRVTQMGSVGRVRVSITTP